MHVLWPVVVTLGGLTLALAWWLGPAAPGPMAAGPAPQLATPTPAVRPPSPPLRTPTPVVQVPSPPQPTPTATPTPPAPPPLPPPPAGRYFPETGFSIRNDAFWQFFNGYGGVRTFGYPISREFRFLGFPVQFFQRQILQQWADGSVHTMNLLDPELMPYTRINGSVFPEPDERLKNRTPSVGSPDYATEIVAFVERNAPEEWRGLPVRFWTTFRTTVPSSEGAPLYNLDIWGAPISEPAYDPTNQGFVYQRYQRGIMHFDVTCMCTQGLLLADWFRALITGDGLPADLAAQAQGSRFYLQYNNARENGLNRPGELPGTDMRFAFEREQPR